MERGTVTTIDAALAAARDGGAAPTVACDRLAQHALTLRPGRWKHRAGARAETLFVAAGHGRVQVGGEDHGLAAGTGVFVAAGEHADVEAETPLRLVRVVVPPAEPTTPRAVSYADEDARDAGIGREFRLLACSSETTQFIGVVPPGRSNMHNHPYDEVAYVVDGEGILHWHDGTSVSIGAGSCILFPRLVFHSLENTGASDLRIMGVLTPAHSPADRVQVLDW